MITLSGKIAVITGGNRGIGYAIAQKLAEAGAHVILLARNPAKLDEAVKNLTNAGYRASRFSLDISNADEVEPVIKQILTDHARIDILINNAGVTKDTLLVRMSGEDWQSVIDINLRGTFNLTRSVMRSMMKQRQGRIINITSVVGIIGNAGQANYAASKAGVIGFTKSVAKELAGRNVTVNAIAPGFVETDMTAGLTDEQKTAYLSSIPLNRFGSGEDVANMALFVASDLSAYITGQVFVVDGGMVM